jgi:hypothetical protein
MDPCQSHQEKGGEGSSPGQGWAEGLVTTPHPLRLAERRVWQDSTPTGIAKSSVEVQTSQDTEKVNQKRPKASTKHPGNTQRSSRAHTRMPHLTLQNDGCGDSPSRQASKKQAGQYRPPKDTQTVHPKCPKAPPQRHHNACREHLKVIQSTHQNAPLDFAESHSGDSCQIVSEKRKPMKSIPNICEDPQGNLVPSWGGPNANVTYV